MLNPASARPRRPHQSGTDGEHGGQSEEFEPLLRRIGDLASQLRALTGRVEQLEGIRPNVSDTPSAPPSPAGRRTYAMLVFLFAALLIGTLLFFAVAFPVPTPIQASALRIVFALAGAGLGALVPGILSVASSGTRVLLRAVGALALFVIIYFFAAFSVS